MNPSYTWRRIWSSKWVVRRGLRWRIGNGESINVRSSPWTACTKIRMVLLPRGNLYEKLKVCDFLDLNGASWNIEKWSRYFSLLRKIES